MAQQWRAQCVLGGCGMVGAILAILGDVEQKGAASAVAKIANTANLTFALALPTLAWGAVLIVLGIALALIFDPQTKKMALYAGASVIALVLTATPYQPLPSAPTSSAAVPGQGSLALPNLFQHADFAPALDVHVSVIAPAGGRTALVTMTCWDSGSGQKWQRDFYIEPGGKQDLNWQLPLLGHAGDRQIELRLESAGYDFVDVRATLPADGRPVEMNIELSRTGKPFFLQKLGQTLGF